MTTSPRRLARGAAQAFREIPVNAVWLRRRLSGSGASNGAAASGVAEAAVPVSAPELEAMTRADLVRVARHLQIGGRSRMPKSDLVSNLARRGVTTEDLAEARADERHDGI